MTISENLSDNVDISVSNDIVDFTWDLDPTSRVSYNGYELKITIKDDVPTDTELTLKI